MLIPTNDTALITAATTIGFKTLTFMAPLLNNAVAPWNVA